MITPQELDEAEKIAREVIICRTPGKNWIKAIAIHNNEFNPEFCLKLIGELSEARKDAAKNHIDFIEERNKVNSLHEEREHKNWVLQQLEAYITKGKAHCLLENKKKIDALQSELQSYVCSLGRESEENEKLRAKIERIKSVFLKSAEETQAQIDGLRAKISSARECIKQIGNSSDDSPHWIAHEWQKANPK